jgi:shikimate dehydrogenase
LRKISQYRETTATVSDRQAAHRLKWLTGLIGAPIAHSASPAMHEQAAAALGARCHYQLIEVAGAGDAELRKLLDGVRLLGYAGVNVTYPYKEVVAGLLDELAPEAAAMGAVNTVVVRSGRLIGHNTDTTGFARSVAPFVAGSEHAPVAVVGAGFPRYAFSRQSGRGPNASRIYCLPSTRLSSPTASRTRCAARRVLSTRRRSACCRPGHACARGAVA